jgi:hypothetical protein
VPASVPDGQYCIRVKVKTVSVMDDSDVFNIAGAAAASITVTKPASPDKWNRNRTYAITWTKTGSMPNAVKISLMDKNSAAVVREIADGVANSGSYSWLVPADVAFGEYRVRVLVKTTQIQDDSDTFSIAVVPLPPGIKAVKQLALVPVTQGDWTEYQRDAQITNWGNPLREEDWVLHDIYNARPKGYPPGAGVNEYAHVGYDYFSYPGTYGTGWTTYCCRSNVWFNMAGFEGKSDKLISAKLHLKQVSSLITGDTHASCGTGWAVFLTPWTNFWNFQVTHIGTGGLEFGKTDYWEDITDVVKKWLDGTLANCCGLLLTSQEVNWGQQAKTCYSAFQASLTLRFKKD